MGRTSTDVAAPTPAALPIAELPIAEPLIAEPLIAAARERLTNELASLPRWGSPTFWAWARRGEDAEPPTLGALAALVAEAMRRDDAEAARVLFTIMLEWIEEGSQRWAARIAARAGGLHDAATRGAVREDLCQELALRLWHRLALAPSEGWWLFFERALEYERRHVAAAYMTRNGYWPHTRSRGQRREPSIRLTRLDTLMTLDARAEPPDARAELAHATADLADLAMEVGRLPERERVAVVLRFWQHAPEAEIALVLGCTERTVRNLLRRAYARLRESYAKGDAIP